MLNWIVWNRTIHIKIDLGLNNLQRLICNETQPANTKNSDSEVSVLLEHGGMRSTPLLPSFPGPLWAGVVALDKGPIYGLNRTNLHTYARLNYLK